MPEIFKKNIKRATRNIISYGDTDVFPYSFENILIRKNEASFVDLVENLAADFDKNFVSNPPQFENVLSPVGYTGYRWVTQIDPYWNCYLLSAVLRHSGAIENVRVPDSDQLVHSYRYLDDDGADQIFKSDINWRSFMVRSFEKSTESEFIVTTDISEFYRRIYHHRIENALERVCEGNIPDKIIKILTSYSNGTSYGLPIGGPAARIIAEIVIDQIDHLLIARGIDFCRFVDDFHIFSPSEEQAYKSLQELSKLLIMNQGLSLQKSKTRVLTGAEFSATFPAHLKPGSSPADDRERLFTINLNYDPYSPNADTDYEALKSSLGEIDFLALLNEELNKSQIHAPTVTRLIKSLRVTTGKIREQAIQTIMENIRILYPVLSNLLIVLRSIISDLSSDEHKFISETLITLVEEKSYLLSLDVHRCYACRILYSYQDYRVDAIFTKWLADGGPALRRDVIMAFAARGGWNHLSDFKNGLSGQTPWVRRAMFAVSYGLGDEGRHWRQAQSQNLFERFVTESMTSLDNINFEELL